MCIVDDSPVAKHLPRRLFQWRPVARRHLEILRTQQRRMGTVPRIGRSKNSGGEIYGEIQIIELVKFQIVEKYFFGTTHSIKHRSIRVVLGPKIR